MQATFLTPDELSQEEIHSLWEQDVCMDDMDYLLVTSAENIHLTTRTDHWDQTEYQEWEANDWALDRVLVGCCSNRWYKATFRGEEVALGIAYHA